MPRNLWKDFSPQWLGILTGAEHRPGSFVPGDWQSWSPAPAAGGPVAAEHFGPFATSGPVVCLAWVLAAPVGLARRPGQ